MGSGRRSMTATVAERGRGRNGVGSADAGRVPTPRPARGATSTDGQARLGGPKQRATLALLLCQPSAVVPASRLVDELWGDDPPASAANLVQGYVSQLRKALGRDAIETRGGGYVIHVARDTLDLQRFELLAHGGSLALAGGTARRGRRISLRGARALARACARRPR